MARFILWSVGISYMLNAGIMWFAPQFWYENVPGIVEMGLYHKHLIRDVGLGYLVAGVGLIYGCLRNPSIAIFAAIWPAFHAFYHIAIFFDRGMSIDAISATNLLLIQTPAWASLLSAFILRK